MFSSTSHEHAPGTAAAVEQFLTEVEQSKGESIRFELLSDLDRAGARTLAEGWLRVPVSLRAPMLKNMVEDAERNVDRAYGRAMHVALDDPDPEARLAAIEGLWEYDTPGLLAQMLTMIAADQDERVRASLALAIAPYVELAELEELDGELAARLTETLLDLHHNDPSTEVRRRALESVGYISLNKRVTTAIKNSYDSGEHQLRVSAMRAMGHQAITDWLPALYDELKSDEPELRFEAVTAIGMIMDERSSTRIVDMIADDDAEVSMAAIHALGSIGGPIAINTLRRIIREEDDEILLDAAQEALDEALLMDNPLRPPL